MKTIKNISIKALALAALVVLHRPIWAQSQPQADTMYEGASDGIVLLILISLGVLLTIIIVMINSAIKNVAATQALWKGKNLKKLPVILLLLGIGIDAFAAAEPRTDVFKLTDQIFWGLVVLDAILFAISIYMVNVLRKITQFLKGEDETAEVAVETAPSWLMVMMQKLSNRVPIEKEQDIMLDHDYDGIHELDNDLPPWWKAMFYLSIVFGVIYLIHFHVIKTGDLSAQEYEKSVRLAEEEVQNYRNSMALNVDENSVTLELSEARISAGKAIYDKNCAVCHTQKADAPSVGPCFHDNYWIHGGSINNIFKTIKEGVPSKGMISWKTQLSPVQIQNVATYIVSLEGAAPCTKEPQGEVYERVATTVE